MLASPNVEGAQLGEPLDRDRERRPAAAEVDVDAPVGGARGDHGAGLLAQDPQRLVERGRAHEPLVAALEPRGDGLGRRAIAAFRERVAGVGGTERERRIPDRAVPGAPAEVAAERVQVEAVRAVVGVGASVDGSAASAASGSPAMRSCR